MSTIGYIAGVVGMATLIGAIALWANRRRSSEERNGVRSYPHGGEMGNLNTLLQEGSISPEEYELIKRRILAGQVY